MTDQEVLNYFTKTTGNTCGRFNADQLQRPLQPTKQEKKKAWWVAMLMPVLMLFKKAEAQKKDSTDNVIKINASVQGLSEVVIVGEISYRHPTDYWPVPDEELPTQETSTPSKQNYVAKLTVMRKKGEEGFAVAGKIIDSKNNEPIAFATVAIKGSNTATATDAQGGFALKGKAKDDHTILTISSVGYEESEVLVKIKDTEEVAIAIPFVIKGKVVSSRDGSSIMSASVVVNGSKYITSTDNDGSFILRGVSKNDRLTITAGFVGYKEKQKTIAVSNSSDVYFILEETPGAYENIVVGGAFSVACKKPKAIDTIPTIIRKIFRQEVFKTYPNPALRGGIVNVDVKKEGNYSIQIFNSSGMLLTAKQFEAKRGAMQTTVQLPSSLTSGMYYIKLVDEKNRKEYNDKIIVM